MSKLSIIRRVLPDSLTQKAGSAGLELSKRSPQLLLVAGIGGFVATTVLASRATLKMDDILESTEVSLNTAKDLFEDKALQHRKGAEYTEEDYLKDRIYIYTNLVVDIGKAYAPAVIVGGVSIYCLTKSHSILSNRNTAIMAAYSALQKSYDEYRKRVRNAIGEEAERDLYFDARYETVVEQVPQEDGTVKEIEATQKRIGPNAYSQYARFFDETCMNWEREPEYNYLFLRAKQSYANDKLRSRGHLFLNEVYEWLGIPHSREGAVVGWVLSDDGSTDNFVDFGFMSGDTQRKRDFVNGNEGAILLDFNVDGPILGKIPEYKQYQIARRRED